MTWIAGHRALEGCGTVMALGEGVAQKLSRGWQDKSAASGRAHVVGLVRDFSQFQSERCWRFPHNPQRFQRAERRRRLLEHPRP